MSEPGGDHTDDLGKEISKIALAVAMVAGGLLLVTGAWLTAFYRPTVSAGHPFQAGPDVPNEPTRDVQFVDWMRVSHRVSATIFVIALIIVTAVAIARVMRGHRRVVSVIAPALAGVLAVLGLFTGKLLPWDQLAVWAVTDPGDSFLGYRAFFGDQAALVRYVIVGGHEVDANNLAIYLIIHALVIPVALVGLFVVGRLAARSRVDPQTESARRVS